MIVFTLSQQNILSFHLRFGPKRFARYLNHADVRSTDGGWEEIPMSALIQDF